MLTTAPPSTLSAELNLPNNRYAAIIGATTHKAVFARRIMCCLFGSVDKEDAPVDIAPSLTDPASDVRPSGTAILLIILIQSLSALQQPEHIPKAAERPQQNPCNRRPGRLQMKVLVDLRPQPVATQDRRRQRDTTRQPRSILAGDT